MSSPTESTNPSPPPRRTATGNVFTPAFIAVSVVLLVCGLTLTATVQSMKLHFKKEPVDIAVYGKQLESLPKDLGPWHMVSPGDERLNEDVEHALGTKEYIFRQYLDERHIGKAVLDSMKTMDDNERRYLLAKYQFENPRAVVHFAVTYYTGMVDTVAHVPDRCYIADGYQPKSYNEVEWGPTSQPVKVRYINFEDQTGAGKVSRNVAYFFHVNGEYKADPLGVRIELQKLTQRYGYYAKVELMTQRLDAGEAEVVMRDFLTHALPEIEACLPDWQRVTSTQIATADAN